MLPKKMRVQKALFPELVRKGAFCSSPHLSLRFDTAPSGSTTSSVKKCAVVVSKKVAKSAVARNRFRRRVSAVVEELLSVAAAPSFVAAIFINRSIADLSPAQLAEEVTFLLKKAKLV